MEFGGVAAGSEPMGDGHSHCHRQDLDGEPALHTVGRCEDREYCRGPARSAVLATALVTEAVIRSLVPTGWNSPFCSVQWPVACWRNGK